MQLIIILESAALRNISIWQACISNSLQFSSIPTRIIIRSQYASVLQQLEAQTLHVIAVLLYLSALGLHLCLLVAAVIREQSDTRRSLFFYYTALPVICKLLSSVAALFRDKLILPIIKIEKLALCVCLPDPIPRLVIGITDRSVISPLFQKLSADIVTVEYVQVTAACGNAGPATGYGHVRHIKTADYVSVICRFHTKIAYEEFLVRFLQLQSFLHKTVSDNIPPIPLTTF